VEHSCFVYNSFIIYVLDELKYCCHVSVVHDFKAYVKTVVSSHRLTEGKKNFVGMLQRFELRRSSWKFTCRD
jgi:hypothetical protein